MKISGFDKLTLLNYPDKVACTIFTSGCNLRCPFCHNSGLVTNNYNEISFDSIYEYLKKRIGILDGVCITGGEPLIHADIKDYIKKKYKTPDLANHPVFNQKLWKKYRIIFLFENNKIQYLFSILFAYYYYYKGEFINFEDIVNKNKFFRYIFH